jgi:hypothetical protein
VPRTGWPKPGGFLPREILTLFQIIADAKPLPGSKSWNVHRPTTRQRLPASWRRGSSAMCWPAKCVPVICRGATSGERVGWLSMVHGAISSCAPQAISQRA